MNFITQIISEELTFALGNTLFHSLWQGAAVALVLATIQLGLRRFSSKGKYLVGVAALVLILSLSVLTFVSSYQSKIELKTDLSQMSAGETFDSQPSDLTTDNALNNKKNYIKNGLNFITNHFYLNMPLIVLIWLIGLIVQSFRFAGGVIYNQRLFVNKTKKISAVWEKRFQTLKKKTGVQQSVRLIESALIKTHIVIGHLKPVILLPIGLLARLPQDQVEAILIHELAHIKRKDYLLNLFQSIIDVLFFYHPAVRWISSVVSEERENCCDDIVVRVSGDKLNFAKALANIQSYQFEVHNYAVAAIGKHGKLFQRISRLFYSTQPNSGMTEKLISILIIALCFVTVAAHSQSFFNTQELKIKSGVITLIPDIQTLQASSISSDKSSILKTKVVGDSVKTTEHKAGVTKNNNTKNVKTEDRFVVKQENKNQETVVQIKNQNKNKATLIFPAQRNRFVRVHLEKNNVKELYLDKIRIYDWELDNYLLLMNEFVKPHFDYMNIQKKFKKYYPVLKDEYKKTKERFEKSLAHKKMFSKEFHISEDKSRERFEDVRKFNEFEMRHIEEEREKLIDELEHQELEEEIRKHREIEEIDEIEKLKQELILNEIELAKITEETLTKENKYLLQSKKIKLVANISELEKEAKLKELQMELNRDKEKLENQVQSLKKVIEKEKIGKSDVPEKELQQMKKEIQEMEEHLYRIREENNVRKRKQLDVEEEIRREKLDSMRRTREAKREMSLADKKYLVNELLKDGLIDDEDDYSFELTNKYLKVNNKKQQKKYFEKYKKIVMSKFNVKFEGRTTFVISTR